MSSFFLHPLGLTLKPLHEYNNQTKGDAMNLETFKKRVDKYDRLNILTWGLLKAAFLRFCYVTDHEFATACFLRKFAGTNFEPFLVTYEDFIFAGRTVRNAGRKTIKGDTKPAAHIKRTHGHVYLKEGDLVMMIALSGRTRICRIGERDGNYFSVTKK